MHAHVVHVILYDDEVKFSRCKKLFKIQLNGINSNFNLDIFEIFFSHIIKFGYIFFFIVLFFIFLNDNKMFFYRESERTKFTER